MLLENFALHDLTPDERATAQTLSARNGTGRVLFMPTHHFGKYGDLTGFRFECGSTASGSSLPVSRRMFFGHTLVECQDSEGDILEIMSQPEENRKVMREFLEATDTDCNAALLDCTPDNSDAVTGRGVLQVRGRDVLVYSIGVKSFLKTPIFFSWLRNVASL